MSPGRRSPPGGPVGDDDPTLPDVHFDATASLLVDERPDDEAYRSRLVEGDEAKPSLTDRLKDWQRTYFPLPDEVIDDYLATDEYVIHQDHPSFRAFLTQNLAPMLVLGIVLPALFMFLWSGGLNWQFWAMVLVLDAVVLFLAFKRLSDRYTNYVITNLRLIRVSGIVSRKLASIAWTRMTGVGYSQSLWGRFLGYATIHLESANEESGLRRFSDINDPERFHQQILDMISGKTGQKEGEETPAPTKGVRKSLRKRRRERRAEVEAKRKAGRTTAVDRGDAMAEAEAARAATRTIRPATPDTSGPAEAESTPDPADRAVEPGTETSPPPPPEEAQPPQPGEPAKPGDSGEPSGSRRPGEPAGPGDAAEPGEPAEPGETAGPGQAAGAPKARQADEEGPSKAGKARPADRAGRRRRPPDDAAPGWSTPAGEGGGPHPYDDAARRPPTGPPEDREGAPPPRGRRGPRSYPPTPPRGSPTVGPRPGRPPGGSTRRPGAPAGGGPARRRPGAGPGGRRQGPGDRGRGTPDRGAQAGRPDTGVPGPRVRREVVWSDEPPRPRPPRGDRPLDRPESPTPRGTEPEGSGRGLAGVADWWRARWASMPWSRERQARRTPEAHERPVVPPMGRRPPVVSPRPASPAGGSSPQDALASLGRDPRAHRRPPMRMRPRLPRFGQRGRPRRRPSIPDTRQLPPGEGTTPPPDDEGDDS